MLKIALINGSPKAKDSASGYLLKDLKEILNESTITEYSFKTPEVRDPEGIVNQDVLVFAFPLYVDGVPSHLLHCLIQLEDLLKGRNSDIKVYAICNSGFYEGYQNKYALEMIRNWCLKAGLTWGQGIGIGAGGMVASIQNVPHGKGPKKNMSIALEALAGNILKLSSAENVFTTPNFPRFLYKMGAEMGWRQMVKGNGMKTRKLFVRL